MVSSEEIKRRLEAKRKGVKLEETKNSKVSVQGILLLIPRPMPNVEDLIQQIIEQQRSKGYSIADNITIKVVEAGNSLGDNAYLYASLKMNFSHLETEEEKLLERTRKHDFQSPDGEKGEYYIIFDREHILK